MERKEEIVTLDLEDDDSPATSTPGPVKSKENVAVSSNSAAIDLPPPRTPELVSNYVCKPESPASLSAAAVEKNGQLCITEDTDKEDALISLPAPLKITLKKRKKKTEVWTYKKQHRKSRKLLTGAQPSNNASIPNGDADLPGAGTPPESADSENEKAEASEDEAEELGEQTPNASEAQVTVTETVTEKSTVESSRITAVKVDGSCKRAHPSDQESAEAISPVEPKKMKKEELLVEVEEVEEISIIERKAEVLTPKPEVKPVALVAKDEISSVKKIEDKENLKEVTKIAHAMRKLSRKELEDLLLRKMVEMITERSASAGFRRRAEAGEKEITTLKSRIQQMQTQVTNLSTAVGRYLADTKQNKDKQPVLPVRITRSVALQVNLVSRPKSQSNHHTTAISSKILTSPSKHRPILPATSPNANQSAKQAIQRPPSLSPVAPPPAKPVVPIRMAPQFTPKVPPSQTSFTHPAFAQVPPRGSSQNAASRSPVKQLYASMLASNAGFPKPAVSSTPLTSVRPPTALPVGTTHLAMNKSLLANLNAQMNPAILHRAPVPGSHSNITTVHKVTLPTAGSSPNRPKIIDLTGEESRAAQKNLNQSILPAVSSPKLNSSVATSIVYVSNTNGTTKRPMVTIPMPTTSIITPVSTSLLLKRPIPTTTIVSSSAVSLASAVVNSIPRHPAPLPQPAPYAPNISTKNPPCKPVLKISKVATGQGLVLSWTMQLTEKHANIETYQLYAYQEGSSPPSTALWKKVGDVKAMPLPMACTLTQFMEGFRYHFAVRAVDDVGREGPYSDPSSILLNHGK